MMVNALRDTPNSPFDGRDAGVRTALRAAPAPDEWQEYMQRVAARLRQR
jgi:hypothetical protein